MRKICLLILACIFVCSFSVTGYANDAVTVKINGEALASPVSARLENGRTLLPMRAIFEELGAKVNWMPDDELIIATKDDLFIVMQIGNPQMTVQRLNVSKKTVLELDVVPFVENGSTIVPVRAVAESLGARVDWEDETWTVLITTD